MKDGVVDIYRTFAEGEARSRRSMLSSRGTRTHPAGRIHAAEPLAVATLCGRTTRDLFEFGRSRYPYERTPPEARCPTCNQLAGRPIPD
jgi:hypothetical protein